MIAKKFIRLMLLAVVPSLLILGCDKKDQDPPAPPPKITKPQKPAPPAETPDATAPEAEPASTEPQEVMANNERPAKKDINAEPPMTDLEELNLVVRDFGAENRRPPKDVEELVRLKLIQKAPEAPAGKKYVIDPKLKKFVLVNK